MTPRTPAEHPVLNAAALVAEYEEACQQARSWTQATSCGIGPWVPGRGCEHPRCLERAAHYARYWTIEAVRAARAVEALLTASPAAPEGETPRYPLCRCPVGRCGFHPSLPTCSMRDGPALAPAPPAPELVDPPQAVVEIAVRQASYSPCQSQRGVVVFTRPKPSEVHILSRGYNRKPMGFECDGSAACKATCRQEAVHAEQDALIGARLSLAGAELLHVKAVGGALVTSGPPSCVACSKLIVEAGIAGVWLYHTDGWKRYAASEFHRLSLPSGPPAPVATMPETPPKVQIGDLVEFTGTHEMSKVEDAWDAAYFNDAPSQIEAIYRDPAIWRRPDEGRR